MIVTSDKVYENDGAGRPFEEGDRLGGHDPYSNSKACAELLTRELSRELFRRRERPSPSAVPATSSAAAIGPPDRLIPDCVRALERGQAGDAALPGCRAGRGSTCSSRSPAISRSRRRLVQAPGGAPRAVNFGPDAASFCTVHEVVDAFSARFAGKPGWRARCSRPSAGGARPDLVVGARRTIAGLAPPSSVSSEALAWTADWYRAYAAGRGHVEVFRGANRELPALGGAP